MNRRTLLLILTISEVAYTCYVTVKRIQKIREELGEDLG